MRTESEIRNASRNIREDILRLAYGVGKSGAHIAPALSMVEILSSLFLGCMTEHDQFVLSKGHGGLCYYAAMHQAGWISREQMESFDKNGGDFPGQPSRSELNKVAFSSGSLGMGLSFGAGLALSKKMKCESGRVFVLLGDGELNEGSVWESAMFSSHRDLNNLFAIVDKNGMQSDGFSKDIIGLDIDGLWEKAGWNVLNCDGHSEKDLMTALSSLSKNKPQILIAKTIKGKGVSFMENERAWHHAHMNEEQFQHAMKEVIE